jgi:hypothetical protein
MRRQREGGEVTVTRDPEAERRRAVQTARALATVDHWARSLNDKQLKTELLAIADNVRYRGPVQRSALLREAAHRLWRHAETIGALK